MGDLYMTSDFKRDAEGNIAIKDGNVSQVNLTNPSYRGSVLPKGNIGFSNDFSWKGFNFGFVVNRTFRWYRNVTDTGVDGCLWCIKGIC